MDRYLVEYIQKDLTRKMVFVGEPRQVGKTTMARSLQAMERISDIVIRAANRRIAHDLYSNSVELDP